MEQHKDFSAEIIEDTCQYLSTNGIMFKEDKLKDTFSYIPAPVALKPSPFSKDVYDKIRTNQSSVNLMMERLMKSISLVHEVLAPLSKIDPFIKNLLDTSIKAKETTYSQLGYLGVLRTDYMVDEEFQPKLVEINTIASGLGFISDKMKGLYEYLIDKHYSSLDTQNLPDDSNNTEQIADAIKGAFELYESQCSSPDRKKILAYIVDYEEANVCDQKLIENMLYYRHKIICRRLTFADITKSCELTSSGELIYNGREEIAVVYYRTGYSPSQYLDQSDWDARVTLEKSLAIKCPSIDLHLLTFKKIQEVLSKNEHWYKMIGCCNFMNINGLFHDQMWGFDDLDEETEAAMEDAKLNPDNYVLKTQREGGGNNYFGDDIPFVLEQTEKLDSYSLMRKINAQQFEGAFLGKGKVLKGKCLSEIGIFGTILVKIGSKSEREVIINKDTGILMRTKGANTNEGGVYGGFSFIDYPYLQ
ncbi:unnamed protein product [Moneuplotes crassus]|uniref:Glutathione synthetase n=2 Tax=Euplotes crassus TaxID=5936 RepID=A0AAD1UCN5_EUPCR|nr:unnamed protein product [Moneuplotes crassus]